MDADSFMMDESLKEELRNEGSSLLEIYSGRSSHGSFDLSPSKPRTGKCLL
jgi:hypothetical protein